MMRRLSSGHLLPAVLIGLISLAGVAPLSGCGRGGHKGGPAASGASPGGTSASVTASGTNSGGPSQPSGTPTGARRTPAGTGWRTSPVRVTHAVRVPPVPTVTGIRTGGHRAEGYDRITFDISGPIPGYEVRYVDKIVSDGTNKVVSIPGRRFLQVTFRPAQAHNSAGQTTITPSNKTVDLAMLRSYGMAGDFEGVVTIGLGLDDTVAFRVGELGGRIYIDMAA